MVISVMFVVKNPPKIKNENATFHIDLYLKLKR